MTELLTVNADAITWPTTFAVALNFLPNRKKYMGKNREQNPRAKPKSKTKNKNQGQLKLSKGPYEVTELLTFNAVAMYNNKFP